MIIESDDCTKVFNVGSGEAHSLSDLLTYIVSLSSQKIDIEVDPERFRPVDAQKICCDNSYILQELGWRPEYNIFQTLKTLYQYYLQ